ncbi:MAG: hypothetical protein ABR511_07705 [Acidimicrobiales bacterium]
MAPSTTPTGGVSDGIRAPAYARRIEPTEVPADATTLGQVLAALEADGYGGQLAARPDGHLVCFTCHQVSEATEAAVDGYWRTEGVSDPDDMLAVAAAVCPRCGTRSTIVLGYGPESSEDDADVLRRLRTPGAPTPAGGGAG